MISSQHITYHYGSIPAICDIELTLGPGDFTGIIGPKGSGKSTLLLCLGGILKPDSGRVILDGRDLQSLSAEQRARSIALVFQENFFPFDFSAYEIVLMGRSPYLSPWQSEGPEDQAIVREAMEACDCWQFRHRNIRALSGGERQRVVLARCLAQRTPVILLDEPTNHLDLGHQSAILGRLSRLCQDTHLTAAAVFHDLNTASQFCSRLVVMSQGRIIRAGSPQEVLTPQTIEEVYHTKVDSLRDARSDRPIIIHSVP